MVFFELGNWGCGEDYPNEEPFLGWLKDDFNIKFMDEQWVIDNGLIVIASNVDMAFNFCITAPDGWVEKNCPSLFDNPEFLRKGTHRVVAILFFGSQIKTSWHFIQ